MNLGSDKTVLLHSMDFGNEAGDDIEDPEQIASYFVEQPNFAEFLEPSKRLLVATAKKGVGKSALLQWIAYRVSQNDPDALIIKCKGSDLVRSRFKLESALTTPNDHIRDWMVRLCGLVNRELALSLDIALTDDQITIIETAELDGFKSRNLVGSLVDRFQKILGKVQPTKLTVQDEVALLKRVNKRVVSQIKLSGRLFSWSLKPLLVTIAAAPT